MGCSVNILNVILSLIFVFVAIVGFDQFYLDSPDCGRTTDMRQRKQYIAQIKKMLQPFVYVEEVNLDIIKVTRLVGLGLTSNLFRFDSLTFFSISIISFRFLILSSLFEGRLEGRRLEKNV